MKHRRTVYIPVVQPGGGADAVPSDRDLLIECYGQLYDAGGGEGRDGVSAAEREAVRRLDAKARDKDWDQVAAPLRKAGLYHAGCVAAGAVRKLGLRRPPAAPYQWLRPRAWIEGQRLHAGGPPVLTEGESAQLGLALVLLMTGAGTAARRVLATGALGGQPRDAEAVDVAVLPFGGLPAKLRLVLDLARRDALPGRTPGGRELLFFTPRRFERDGAPPVEVLDLPEVGELAREGVRVVPVARLSEAARALGALRARTLAADRVLQAAALAVALIGTAGAGWLAWRDAPIAMAFVPPDGATGAEPFRVCFTADGAYDPVPLGRDGIAPVIGAGETLGWRVRVGEPGGDPAGGLGRWLGGGDGYYVAQAMVSELSRAKVAVPRLGGGEGALRVAPGGLWEWSWELDRRPETSGLVLLARRDAPFDPDELRAALVERFPRAAADTGDGTLDVTAAVNFLAKQAPGAVTFVLKADEPGRNGCGR